MTGLRRAFSVPKEIGQVPILLSVVVQFVALLALVTIVRDDRPSPAADPVAWERMGAFVLFSSIAPLAVLFTIALFVALHAISASSPVERGSDAKLMTRTLEVGAVVIDSELVWFGTWKGIWEMFAPLAAIAPVDLALTFLLCRFSD